MIAAASRRLGIGIATSGRFHVLHLARDLAALGHSVVFYSMLPHSRVNDGGLDCEQHRFSRVQFMTTQHSGSNLYERGARRRLCQRQDCARAIVQS